MIRAAAAARNDRAAVVDRVRGTVEVCDHVVAFDLAGTPVEIIERGALTSLRLARPIGMAS